MKTLHLDIHCCSECPYSVYREYAGTGVSFGLDYYCKLGADNVGQDHITHKFKPKSRRPMTKEESDTLIRKDCPL